MNRRKAVAVVIFDCDGVMFDSRQANVNYYNHILARFGCPPMTENEVDYVHMHTGADSIRHIFRGTRYVSQALEYTRELDYTPFISDMIIEPGLKTLLDKLKPEIGLAVATNRSHTIGKVLAENGLEGYFDIVVSSLDVPNPKPHPDALFRILDFFRVEPTRSLYVGDSMVDYETARAAGVAFVAYRNRRLEADYHVDSLVEIIDIL